MRLEKLDVPREVCCICELYQPWLQSWLNIGTCMLSFITLMLSQMYTTSICPSFSTTRFEYDCCRLLITALLPSPMTQFVFLRAPSIEYCVVLFWLIDTRVHKSRLVYMVYVPSSGCWGYFSPPGWRWWTEWIFINGLFCLHLTILLLLYMIIHRYPLICRYEVTAFIRCVWVMWAYCLWLDLEDLIVYPLKSVMALYYVGMWWKKWQPISHIYYCLAKIIIILHMLSSVGVEVIKQTLVHCVEW